MQQSCLEQQKQLLLDTLAKDGAPLQQAMSLLIDKAPLTPERLNLLWSVRRQLIALLVTLAETVQKLA